MAKPFSVSVQIGGEILPSLRAASAEAKRLVSGIGTTGAGLNPAAGFQNLGRDIRVASTGAAREVAAHGRRMARAGRATTGTGLGASGMALGLGLIARDAARAVYGFEEAGNTVEAVTEATTAQRKELGLLARDYGYLTGDIVGNMKAIEELGRTGFGFAQIKGTLEDALKASAVGNMPTGQAVDIFTNIAAGLRVPMETADQARASMREIADAVTFAANKSNQTVADAGQFFKYAAPVGAAVGLDVQDLAGMSIVAADQGIRGPEMGTALRSMAVRLAAPTDKAMAAIGNLGLNWSDYVDFSREVNTPAFLENLKFQGTDVGDLAGVKAAVAEIVGRPGAMSDINGSVAAITREIVTAMGDVDAEARKIVSETVGSAFVAGAGGVDLPGFIRDMKNANATLADTAAIFSMRQSNRALALMAGDVDGQIDRVRTQSPGYTDRAFALANQGVVGDWKALTAEIQNAFLAIADAGVLKDATTAIRSFSAGLKTLSQSSPAFLRLGTHAALAGVALAPLAIVAGSTVTALGGLARGLGFVTSAALGIGTAGAGTRAIISGIGSAAKGAVAGVLGLRGALRGVAAGAAMLRVVGMGSLFTTLAGGAAAAGSALLALSVPALAVAAGIAAAGLAINRYWDAIAAFSSGFASSISGAVSGAAAELRGFAATILPASVIGALEAVPARVSAALSGLGGTISSAIDTAGAGFGSLFERVTFTEAELAGFHGAGQRAADALVAPFRSAATMARDALAAIGRVDLGAMGRRAATAFLAGLRGIANGALAIVRGVRVAFTGIDLTGAGAAVIPSFWNGMKAKAAELLAWAGQIAAKVKSALSGGGVSVSNGSELARNVSVGRGHQMQVRKARALGGFVLPGQPTLVGERGPEIVRFGARGHVDTAARTARALNDWRPSNSNVRRGVAGAGIAAVMAGTTPAAARPQTVDASIRIDHMEIHAPSGEAQDIGREVDAALDRAIRKSQARYRAKLTD